MPNIELLEKSLPVAPIRIAALSGCQDLAKEVDKKLVKFRRELVEKKQPSTSFFFPFSARHISYATPSFTHLRFSHTPLTLSTAKHVTNDSPQAALPGGRLVLPAWD